MPANLCVPVPEGVDFEQAAFATVGSIALHGVRQADVQLGERVAVIGLGLVGQLAAQLLRAAGCRVVGIDLVAGARRARVDGAGRIEAFVRSDGAGSAGDCDAVLITAATAPPTRSSSPRELCRDRGRVVVVGDVGMEVPRAAYYEKELELRLSRSYGPGRYDREYEERGLDYPIGYVRWTERRNMAAFLELVAAGQVDVEALITSASPSTQAAEAYERLRRAPSARRSAIVLEYERRAGARPARAGSGGARSRPRGRRVGVIGAGSFATANPHPGLAARGLPAALGRERERAVGARGRGSHSAFARASRAGGGARATRTSASSRSRRGTTRMRRSPLRRCAPARRCSSRSRRR